MPQNKNRSKVKIKMSQTVEDAILLKKLPGLLALCEFILIPVLIISPPLSSGAAHIEDPHGRDNTRPNNVGSVVVADRGSAQEPTLEERTPREAQIAAAPEPLVEPKEVIKVTVTAYSSTKDQTDETPFHTANGKDVEDGIVAANFLPLGTQLRIPEVFEDKIFTVQDRMHERFDHRIDIWMPTREAAQAFGIRYLKVEIM